MCTATLPTLSDPRCHPAWTPQQKSPMVVRATRQPGGVMSTDAKREMIRIAKRVAAAAEHRRQLIERSGPPLTGARRRVPAVARDDGGPRVRA